MSETIADEVKNESCYEVVDVKENDVVCETDRMESTDNHIEKDVESEDELKTSITSILMIQLEYCDATKWLNGDKVLTSNDLKNVFKYSQNLCSMREISVQCAFSHNNDNEDCFNEYKDKCFEYLLNANAITFLNKILKNSPKLEHISFEYIIFNGYFKSLFKDVDLSNITTLKICNMRIYNEVAPANIYNELKEKFSELKRLKYFTINNVTCDDLVDILTSLPNKEKIELLELSYIKNLNEKFNNEISQFSNLKTFSFGNSETKSDLINDLINKLPITIESLEFYEIMHPNNLSDENDLMSNGTEKLIERINELKNLKVLRIWSNGKYIKSIDMIINNLYKFTELREFSCNDILSKRDIYELCKNIKYLSNLEILILTFSMTNKPFEELCNSLCNLNKLKEIYICGIEISNIDPFVKNIKEYKSLEYLRISGEFVDNDNLLNVIDGILQLDNFKTLKIDYIKITEKENEKLKKKIDEAKNSSKEIIIHNIIITDKKNDITFSQDYRSGYIDGFICGFDNSKTDVEYYDEDMVRGFNDGYEKGSEYRKCGENKK